jgi:hypothetical protein
MNICFNVVIRLHITVRLGDVAVFENRQAGTDDAQSYKCLLLLLKPN